MGTRRDFHKVIVGRSEGLSLVEVGVANIPAKTDTGAYRSAIHADKIEIDKDGVLHFRILGKHPVCGEMAAEMTAKRYGRVNISNSFGHSERRYEVRLKVKLGPKVFVDYFTLADRSKKIYPILLGRKLLNGRFLVDSDKNGLNRQLLLKEHGIDFPMDEEDGR